MSQESDISQQKSESKIKAFFHRKELKNALIFFCFVLLALAFWMIQSLQRKYEIDVTFPVKYRDVPANIVFKKPLPQVVTVRVRDKGTILLNYTFGHKFIPLDISMKDISIPSGMFNVPNKKIVADVTRQLLSSTVLISTNPQQIESSFGHRVKKSVPVHFNGMDMTDAGFKVSGEIIISPSEVSVYSSKEFLNSINEVETVYTKIIGNKSFVRSIRLKQIQGATISPSVVTVKIPIDEFTEKTLEIPVVCLSLPGNYTLHTFPSVVKVTCNVPISRFKDISSDDFAVQIPFSEFEKNESGKLSIQLSKKPDWVDAARLIPDKIEFILEQKDL